MTTTTPHPAHRPTPARPKINFLAAGTAPAAYNTARVTASPPASARGVISSRSDAPGNTPGTPRRAHTANPQPASAAPQPTTQPTLRVPAGGRDRFSNTVPSSSNSTPRPLSRPNRGRHASPTTPTPTVPESLPLLTTRSCQSAARQQAHRSPTGTQYRTPATPRPPAASGRGTGTRCARRYWNHGEQGRIFMASKIMGGQFHRPLQPPRPVDPSFPPGRRNLSPE